jgi:hypothetical protein
VWSIPSARDQQRLQQLALGQLLACPHRHDRLVPGGILGRGLRLGRSDGDREPVLRAPQRVALEGQVGGHHLCQAGDRGRLLVRARRRPAVAERERRLPALWPADRRHVGAALVVEHAVRIVKQVAGCREGRVGEE